MISHKRITKTCSFFIIILLFGSSISNIASAQDGKTLFTTNCASCHAVDKKLTGPALKGVEDRWPDKKKLHAWIKNNQAVLKSGDKYANDLYNQFNKINMQVFPNLADADIDAILKYIREYQPPVAAKPAVAVSVPAGDPSMLFGILSLVLAVLILILMRINSKLKRIAYEKEGVTVYEPVPFWRHKTVLALAAITFFLAGGYLTTKAAIGLGRNKDYQPVQPIFYSHKVHAGINQINCLYCHGSAQDGRHANIPSVNICMNCHQAISEYKGEKIYTEEGKEVNGSDEIKKLYDFAGYTPGQAWDASKAKPIEWVRVHNLPDYVYFNHSQHIKAGKVQCQTCHGEVTKMDEVKQFSELSMGWCINCHRETKVQFNDNGFYSIYKKFHEDIKNGKLDSVTVEKIGGTECQKCHY